MEVVSRHLNDAPFEREALEGMHKFIHEDLAGETKELKDRIFRLTLKPENTVHSASGKMAYWYAAAGIAFFAALTAMVIYMVREPLGRNRLASEQSGTIVEELVLIDYARTEQDTLKNEIRTSIDTGRTRLPENVNERIVLVENPAGEREINDDVVIDADLVANDTLSQSSDASDYETAQVVIQDLESESEEEVQIFMVVEQMPEFPGGEEKLYRFLADSIRYPESAKESSIQGRVFVTFTVEKDGSISDARILRGIGGGCDEEALRVIQLMPKWNPGMQRGKPVRVQYNIPVKFTLSN